MEVYESGSIVITTNQQPDRAPIGVSVDRKTVEDITELAL
jgi:hypothetical protein